MKPSLANLRYFSRTVYARRAINAIKKPISLLEWEIRPLPNIKESPELKRQIEIATNSFRHPNRQDSFHTLIELSIEDYCVFGAAVIEQQLSNSDDRPIWMWPVDAQSIRIYCNWQGGKTEPKYLQTLGYLNIGIQQGINLTDDEIIYITENGSNETPYGFGAVEIAYNSISRLLGVGNYTGALASNANPQNIIFIEGADTATITAFRQYWTNLVEGQGQTPIIGGGQKLTIGKLTSGDDNALFIKFQEFLIREIASAFNLSPQNLGVTSDVNRSVGEVAEDRDWDQGIKPVAMTFARAFTREVLHKRLGFHQIEFCFKGLDREDELNLAKIYDTEYKSNAITPNEYREQRGLPPMDNDWGDKCFADMQIAVSAARGIKQVDDPDINLKKSSSPTSRKDDASY